MIKYAVTSACMNKCEYCIMRNVSRREEIDLDKVRSTLNTARALSHQIMLTGGEPTLSRFFNEKVEIARELFDEVYLSTANWRYMASPQVPNRHIDAITYTIHRKHDVNALINSGMYHKEIYVAIVWPQLAVIVDEYAEALNHMGFKGLTVNEDHRGTAVFDEESLVPIPGFSYKINRRGHCLDDMPIVMPDLEVEMSFSKWV